MSSVGGRRAWLVASVAWTAPLAAGLAGYLALGQGVGQENGEPTLLTSAVRVAWLQTLTVAAWLAWASRGTGSACRGGTQLPRWAGAVGMGAALTAMPALLAAVALAASGDARAANRWCATAVALVAGSAFAGSAVVLQGSSGRRCWALAAVACVGLAAAGAGASAPERAPPPAEAAAWPWPAPLAWARRRAAGDAAAGRALLAWAEARGAEGQVRAQLRPLGARRLARGAACGNEDSAGASRTAQAPEPWLAPRRAGFVVAPGEALDVVWLAGAHGPVLRGRGEVRLPYPPAGAPCAALFLYVCLAHDGEVAGVAGDVPCARGDTDFERDVIDVFDVFDARDGPGADAGPAGCPGHWQRVRLAPRAAHAGQPWTAVLRGGWLLADVRCAPEALGCVDMQPTSQTRHSAHLRPASSVGDAQRSSGYASARRLPGSAAGNAWAAEPREVGAP